MRFSFALVFAGLCSCFVAANASRCAAAVDDQEALLQADRVFEQTFSGGQSVDAGKLMDAEFTWTDSAGRVETKSQILESLKGGAGPKAHVGGGDAKVMEYVYGQVGVVQRHSGNMHALCVWVKRGASWKALVYQEVKSLDVPPVVTPGVGKVCENPCKAVPYRAKDATERGVLESYMALESAAMSHNASEFAAHVADEFIAASSNSNELLDKRSRMAGLEREKMTGVSPTPLVSARMFVFGDSVVMTSLHKPDRGKLLHITRVWIRRNDNWVETLSYQTAIQTELP